MQAFFCIFLFFYIFTPKTVFLSCLGDFWGVEKCVFLLCLGFWGGWGRWVGDIFG